MANDRHLAYRIIDAMKRPNSINPDDEQMPFIHTYLTFDSTDIIKSKYVLRIVDLEQITHFMEFIKEILWYKQLSHANLMSLKDCFLIDSKLYLLKPYAAFGSCADLLCAHPFGVREHLISLIMWQVLQALRYLQDKYIMHRAVASKNIFICNDGRVLLDNFSHCISMISPFDGKLRRQLYDYNDGLKDQILYLAPEVIFQSADGYNYKSDIYSLGTVACELANGSHTYLDMPFGNLSVLLAKAQGSEPFLLDQTELTPEMVALSDDSSIPYVEEIKRRRYGKEFHSFVKCCVATRLDLRCSADELQTHSFLKHVKKISHDPQLLADDMAKALGTYTPREYPILDMKTTSNNTVDRLFADTTDNSNKKHHSTSLFWEF